MKRYSMWKQIRIWILLSWCLLTVGILLGSWWAYHELGWGGWWFWDPVENASLMPWLLATACIHSITKSKLNHWTLIFIQSTFFLSILGTFFVRSGLLSSVHSFATDSTRGFYLLIFLLYILALCLFSWWNYHIQKKNQTYPKSKESLFLKLSFFHKLKRYGTQIARSVFSLRKIFWVNLLQDTRQRFDEGSTKERKECAPLLGIEDQGSTKKNGSTKDCLQNSTGKKKYFFQSVLKNDRKLTKQLLTPFVSYKMVTNSKPFSKKYRVFPVLQANNISKKFAMKLDQLSPRNVNRNSSSLKELLAQILLLQNLYLCIICAVVFWGTSAPIASQWIWNRDIGTGAPFYNSTLIPLFTSIFVLLIFMHYISLYRFNQNIKTTEFFENGWLLLKRTLMVRRRRIIEPFRFSFVEPFYSKRKNGLFHFFKSPSNLLVFSLILFFFVHFSLAFFFFQLNFLNSVYTAFCFLFVSAVLISNGLITKPYSYGENLQYFRFQANLASKPYSPLSPLSILRRTSDEYLAGFQSLKKDTAFGCKKMSSLNDTLHILTRYSVKKTKLQKEKTSFSYVEPIHYSQKEMNTSHTGIVLLILGILLSNTFKLEFTEQFHSAPIGIRLGSQICCLRSIDHSFAPTFHSICANLIIYPNSFSHGSSVENEEPKTSFSSVEPFFHKTKTLFSFWPTRIKYFENSEVNIGQRLENTTICLFPEKRFYFSNVGSITTKVAIHSNLFTDFYGLIGTGSTETGWFTTIIKLPFIFCIWLGFSAAALGGLQRLKKLFRKPKLYWI